MYTVLLLVTKKRNWWCFKKIISHLLLSTGLFLLFTIFPHPCLPQEKNSPRVVETAYGTLRGLRVEKSGNMPREVEVFLGVPYASPPSASLRFTPPLTPSHWQGVREASRFGPVCPQLLPPITNRTYALSLMPLLKYTRLKTTLHLLANQSEDCLYLNIYVPIQDNYRSQRVKSSASSLPIVIILHGESWEWGAGSLVDGSGLASISNLIVITLNYRLGILGFLQTSSHQGNFALMDIVAALNWIHENGAAFGGDTSRITLLGHRTGAVLANFLMLAPVASELFHRVILLSGSALSPWSFQRHAKGNIRKLSEIFKCTNSSQLGPNFKSDFGPCLREMDVEELLKSVETNLAQPRFISRLGPLIDSTVVRGDFVSEMKFDSSSPFSRFQLLVGVTSVESFEELNAEDVEDGLSDGKRDRILRTLVRNIYVFHLNEIFSTVKNEYTDWEKPRKDFIDVRDSILNILSDGLSVGPLVQVALSHSKHQGAKTFFFHFEYESDHSIYPHRLGSISEDLLEFSLGLPLLNPKKSKREERVTLPSFSNGDSVASLKLIKYLTNFISTGDPNQSSESGALEDSQLPYWDSYDPVNQLYLEMSSGEGRMRSHYRGHKMALWLNLIPQLHQSGGSDVSMLHHNFKEERAEYYEGAVREQSKIAPTSPPPPPKSKLDVPKSQNVGNSKMSASGEEDYDDEIVPTFSPASMSSSECPPNATNSSISDGGEIVRQLATSHIHSYGTALGVTIGVGCCLLLLNLLIFLAIYHQKTHMPVVTNRKEEVEVPEESANNCHHHFIQMESANFPYNEVTSAEEYEEDLVQELRRSSVTYSGSKDGFCSPPIPQPPPPPRGSIPPSLSASLLSLNSSNSVGVSRPTGTNSMKKRVQIQEISV